MKFIINSTRKYGVGVYATELIKEGEVITILEGQSINEKDCDDMIARGELNNDDPLQIAADEYYILNEISHAFNHSCEPNAGLKGISTLFALKDILPKEEIVYDYATTVYPENFTFTTMKNCLCGSEKCRKVLGNVLSIPEIDLSYYKKKGALQDYINLALENRRQ